MSGTKGAGMDFELSFEQKTFRESMRKFAEKEVSPGIIERDMKGEFNWEAWKKAGEFGILGLPIPEEYGGGGADIMTMMAGMEGFGLGCRDAGFYLSLAAHTIIGEIPIWKFGSEKQKLKYLPKMCSGEWVSAYGLSEPDAGSDATSLRTSAIRKADHYVLNGTKMFITNGPIADVVVVFATVDKSKGPKGITAFIVEKGSPGFSVSRALDKMGQRTSPTGELVFEDCAVPLENRLGEEGQGMPILIESLEWERACLLTGSIGVCEYELARCVKYANERVQFGKPIGQFQLIQERLANMKWRLEASRLLVYRAAWMKQKGIPARMEAAIAKLVMSETRVANSLDAVQIHGGYGYMREFEVERVLRDSIAATIGAGSTEIQKITIARHLLSKKG
jgi:alkylation response protein AidB-like acyl-CoA dehydrogenase